MNPSGPRLFLVGILFITASISLLVIDLFRWLISSWFNFDYSNASRNLAISSRFSSLFEYKFSKYSLMIF
jgi:hypothetical protein